ncbi:MAG: Dyp-type peroxidase [Cyanobacteriota bacterium]
MSAPTIDYGDVQGLLLRGYRVNHARHFMLRIVDPAATGDVLLALLSGADGLPAITTAARITPKPPCFLNVSFSSSGLRLLGLTEQELSSFDPSFRLGSTNPSVARAIGDIGESAPEHWIGGLNDGDQVHLVLSLWVRESLDILETISSQLRTALGHALQELSVHEATALPDSRVHFGYRDNISQPTIKGQPPGKYPAPDHQEPVETGEFLLGYPNQSGGTYSVKPQELARNSSYAAFRILEQDVQAFEALIQTWANQLNLDPELVAAKICGRWRNGNPLVLSPDQQAPTLPRDEQNNFTYSTADRTTDDTLGFKCPLGSHIRRNNPRNQAVVGTDANHHRLLRRAMPYGPAYDPATPDTKPRGLVGYFINASIQNQFEFLTRQWDMESTFVKSAVSPEGADQGNAVFNISGEDLFVGINAEANSSFTFPGPGRNGKGNTIVTGFGRTITTRGGVYCFFPSISGIKYLAARAKGLA